MRVRVLGRNMAEARISVEIRVEVRLKDRFFDRDRVRVGKDEG